MGEGEAPRGRGFLYPFWERWIRKNLALKAISVAFAVLLWSIITVNDNTERIKAIHNVPWLPYGQAEMRSGKRLIATNLNEVRATIPTVTVRVRAYQGDIAFVTADKLDVTLDLSTVDSTGEQDVRLKARYTGLGKVEEIIPSRIKVDIDAYETRQFPIQVERIDEPPEGLWLPYDGAVITKTIAGGVSPYLRVSGPSSELNDIAAAVAAYDLSTVRAGTTINDQTLSYRYVDGHGNTLDGTNLTNDAGSVIIASVNAYPIKTVPIDTGKAIIGDPDPDYIVSRVEALPAEVEIANVAWQLRAIESLSVRAVNVDGWTASRQVTTGVLPPTVDWLHVGPEQVQLNIILEKNIILRTFENIRVEAIDGNEGDRITIQPVTVVV